jgi:plasmid replication initiation protein
VTGKFWALRDTEAKPKLQKNIIQGELLMVTMKDLLECGVHFGHQTRRWNPKMKKFIFGVRKNIYIIDLQKTLRYFRYTYNIVRDRAATGQTMIFVGTKKQASEAIKRAAISCGMPYLKQVKQKFVLYNLKEVANFGSLYSTRLYELLQEFKDTGWLVKSVKQLREVFAVGKKYSAYKDFKLKTFAHAVNEINVQYPTMKLRFEEIKEGRKVVSIDFRFTPSTIVEQYNPVTKQIVKVTQKPKQVQPKRTKKDDDNTPPPVHPDQQELPNLEPVETKQSALRTSAEKVFKALGGEIQPEVRQALNERKDTSIKETVKAVAKGALNADKRRIKDVLNMIKCTREEFYELINIEIHINKLNELEAFRKISTKYVIQD